MKIGDTVKVIASPFLNLHAGTICEIVDIDKERVGYEECEMSYVVVPIGKHDRYFMYPYELSKLA